MILDNLPVEETVRGIKRSLSLVQVHNVAQSVLTPEQLKEFQEDFFENGDPKPDFIKTLEEIQKDR